MESDRISSTPSDGTSSSSLQRVRPSHGRTTGPTRRSTKGQWTSEEDDILCKAVQRFKGKNWKKIAECFKDRTDVQCLHRWQKVLNPELVKGPWSKEEDEIIVECVDRYGPKKWSTIAQHLPGRIGKQCRERWHNHLNPAINKEAWTQDEELTLIRAHQIYGNKWAELTKFLPGRTDNSIKNHWNSSVKKKLESYLASGLLAQFPALPNVIHQNQSVPSSDDSARKEVEEVSECSQGSNLATSDTFVHKREDGVLLEDSNHRRDPSSSSAGIYTPAFEDISFSVAEVPNEVSTSSNHEWRKDWQFNPDDIPNISPLELMQDSSGLFIQCLTDNNTHDMVVFQQPHTVNFGTTTSIGSMVEGLDNTLNEVFDSSVCFPCENTGADSLIYQSSNYQISQDTLTEKCNPPHCSDVIDAELSSLMFQFSQVNASNGDGFLCSVESGTPFDNAMDDPLLEETKDSIPQVSVNDFRSNTIQTCPLGIEPKEEKKDEGGALCYEPPRFPSLDMPFFSCDLIQSGTDAQQEFSPLGIRQLMMTSSMNCLTPFRLWDSPSRDDTSPDAVLKSAAKTFTGTPSILKKRHRDLVSPLSEKRCEKKLESDCVRQASFSDLARDFSRLDVMFGNENATTSTDQTLELQASSSEDKENINPTEDERKGKTHFDGTTGKIKQPSGVLVELNASDLFFSPNRSERTTNLSNKALGSNYNRRLEAAASNQGVFESSCFSVICSPRGVHGNKDGSSFLMTTTSAPPSLDNTAEASGNGVGTENISSISGVTPYKWNIESPSAWKSPWFINSFLSSPRLDNTEINFEELALFLSPADKSYDAIGLMKQLSEQSAGAFADAQQVLGGETPESILRGRNSKNQKADENPSLIATNAMSERRTLDFSECGSPGKEGKEAEKLCANKTSFSNPSSSYLLKGCR